MPDEMSADYVSRDQALAELRIRRSRLSWLIGRGILAASGARGAQLISRESIAAYQLFLETRPRTRKPPAVPASDLIPRLLARADLGSGVCWLWTGSVNNRGYGHTSWNGRLIYVHRLAYLAWIGAIPEGAVVCHRCDVPACFRPDHLFLGSQVDNMRDSVAKRRNAAVTHPERVARGERAGGVRLTPEGVREIRRRRLGGETVSSLARAFGVARITVRNAALGRTWADLGEASA